MSPAAPKPSLHPLYQRLQNDFGYPALTLDSLDAFTTAPGDAVLFFGDEPLRLKEALDLAVILPEIARAFPGRFRVGVLLPPVASALAVRFGVRRWPALVFVRGGEYVGAIEGLKDWDVYLAETKRLLAAPAARVPTLGVPAAPAPAASGTHGVIAGGSG